MSIYRQGDVLVMARGKISTDGMERVPDVAGRVILQHGTATGHAHAIRCEGAELWRPTTAQTDGLIGDRVLRLPTRATLVHDEHDPIDLAAGTYLVRVQKEYAPEALRNVAD